MLEIKALLEFLKFILVLSENQFPIVYVFNKFNL